MVKKGLLLVVALALTGCGAPATGAAFNSTVSPGATSASEVVPERGYLAEASDNSWYLFVQVDNDQGTVDSAVYASATNQVSVEHGAVTLTSGVLEITGIDNNSWIANGCDCEYQQSGGDLIVSVSTSTGIQQWTLVPADVSQYNAGVQALNAEQQASASASAAASDAAAQAASAAAAAAAQEAASASAAAASAAQAILSREEATCHRVGGSASTWGGGYVCDVGYVSPADGSTNDWAVTFDAEGNVVPDACQDNGYTGSDCTSNNESASRARAHCLSGSFTDASQSEWHPETDICST
jgi:hypothetical protein